MGRGILTDTDLNSLARNPFVASVGKSKITYTEEFKLRFLQEYFAGKKPMRIFKDAGFDVAVLGSKRIERCSARWREANAAGSLGKKYDNNNFYDDRSNENEYMMLERKIKAQEEEINRLKAHITLLENKCK